MILEYFANFEDIVNSIDFILSTEIQKRKINDFIGIIEGRLRFEKGTLDFIEVIKLNENLLTKTKYKYHFRNLKEELIFRYDNVPHHQNIATFPHHKHILNNIIGSQEPNLLVILAEIKQY